MTYDEALELEREICQDRSHEWQAWHSWVTKGVYHVDAVHRPTQRRQLFRHRDEWLAVQNHQPTRRRKVKA